MSKELSLYIEDEQLFKTFTEMMGIEKQAVLSLHDGRRFIIGARGIMINEAKREVTFQDLYMSPFLAKEEDVYE